MRVPHVLVPLVVAACAACSSSGTMPKLSGHTIPSFAASGIANFFAQF